MRSFIIALLLLILIFLGICFNSFFINRKILFIHDALFELATDELYSSEENLFKIENLHRTWKEYRGIMRFFFRRDLIQNFEDAIISLKAFAKGNSYGDFLESFEISLEFLDEMERNNNFDLSMIF